MKIWITLCAALLSVVIAGVGGIALIPYLRKIHFGQTILEEGPAWHKSKQGTPIMGGFLFMVGSIVSTVLFYAVWRMTRGENIDISADTTAMNGWKLLATVIFSMLYACIGFADDYIKAVKKQNLGLTATQKTAAQLVLCGLFLGILYLLGDTSTEFDFVFFRIDFHIFYYPIVMAMMYYISNAVNLTDGVDGLCGTVSTIAMLALTIVAGVLRQYELSLYAIAIAGGCIGFLFWNLHPAKCFMGDTGSMYLGGAFAAIGIALHMHLLTVLIGLVYVLDAFSVVLQVGYFKYTKKRYGEGRRIFKMSPIHHHFELCKWSEYKIVTVFALFGLGCAVLAAVSAFLTYGAN